MFPILGIMASQISGHLSNTAYESIETVTVGSGGEASITFSSIAADWKHLQIRVFASPTTADVFMKFNGDGTTTNYSRHYLYGDGSAADGGGIRPIRNQGIDNGSRSNLRTNRYYYPWWRRIFLHLYKRSHHIHRPSPSLYI
jgi:hypothetical protein